MMLTPLHNKIKSTRIKNFFSSLIIAATGKSASFKILAHATLVKMLYSQTLLSVKHLYNFEIFKYDNGVAMLTLTSSVGFPVIILSPERHIVKIRTLLLSKITSPWRTRLKNYTKQLIYYKYKHERKCLDAYTANTFIQVIRRFCLVALTLKFALLLCNWSVYLQS